MTAARTMPEKDPTAYSFITYAWIVFLSAWGGAISFLRKRKSGAARPFNIVELVGELMTSGLSGLITFWPVSYTHLDVYKRQRLMR